MSHVSAAAAAPSVFGVAPEGAALVGRRTASLLNPVSKAPMVSALDTLIS